MITAVCVAGHLEHRLFAVSSVSNLDALAGFLTLILPSKGFFTDSSQESVFGGSRWIEVGLFLSSEL